MKKTLLKRQIPTILGLIVLFIGAGAGVILVGSGAGFLPRAGPEYTPKNLQITNVTDETFTVSWVTDEPTVGFLSYGDNPSVSTTITDDRDQVSGDTGSFRTHHVTVRGLAAETTYYFKIGSGPGQDLYDNAGQPYEVTTGARLGAAAEAETINGKVVTIAETPAEGAIVYVRINTAAPVSTLVRASGSWAISLSSIRETSLDSYVDYDPIEEQISIEVVGTDGLSTFGTITPANGQPVPTITLGQEFNFTDSINTSRDEGIFANQTTDDESANSESEIELLNPSYDGETINTSRPEIQGSAPPNTLIEITVESPQVFEDQLTTGPTGEFSWSPPEDLEPGEHTITLSWLDRNGIRQFFQRNFVVLAQGESELPALTATPSGSTPSPTPLVTATPVPTTVPTSTPTALPTTTPMTTVTPTPTSRATQPATDSSVPQAGSTSQTILMLLTGAGFISLGFILSVNLRK